MQSFFFHSCHILGQHLHWAFFLLLFFIYISRATNGEAAQTAKISQIWSCDQLMGCKPTCLGPSHLFLLHSLEAILEAHQEGRKASSASCWDDDPLYWLLWGSEWPAEASQSHFQLASNSKAPCYQEELLSKDCVYILKKSSLANRSATTFPALIVQD